MKDDDDEMGEKVELQSNEFKSRGIYIRKEDLREENYGMMPGCRGCEAANTGITGVHNERCRLRIEKAIEEKEPNRYARALARLSSESQHEDKSGGKRRVPSQEEKEEGQGKEEKRRRVEPSPSPTSDEQAPSTWTCPRCGECNPMIYKFCPSCTGNQNLGETS